MMISQAMKEQLRGCGEFCLLMIVCVTLILMAHYMGELGTYSALLATGFFCGKVWK